MIVADLPVGYYAVPDPDAPQILVVVWRGVQRKTERPKVTVKRRAPKDLLYAPQSRATSRDRVAKAAWWSEVSAAILADPDEARRTYSRITVKCWVCGHRLTDPESKRLGIGPDCRANQPQAAKEI